jgi:hypothetical protein
MTALLRGQPAPVANTWRCSRCGASPRGIVQLALDPGFGFGRCAHCGTRTIHIWTSPARVASSGRDNEHARTLGGSNESPMLWPGGDRGGPRLGVDDPDGASADLPT